MKPTHLLVAFALTLVAPVTSAFAQGAPQPDAGWQQLVAYFINTIGVVLVTQLLKNYVLPVLPPAAFPIIAGAMGPTLAFLANRISVKLGMPIDLSMIDALFAGGSAVAVNQFFRLSSKPESRVRKVLG